MLYSEMDVFWFSDPSHATCTRLAATGEHLLAMDNVHTEAINFGFFAIRMQASHSLRARCVLACCLCACCLYDCLPAGVLPVCLPPIDLLMPCSVCHPQAAPSQSLLQTANAAWRKQLVQSRGMLGATLVQANDCSQLLWP